MPATEAQRTEGHTVPPAAPARPPSRRRRWGAAVSSSGVLLLCVTFFLPHVPGCSGPVVPVEETASTGGHFLFGWGLPFLLAILVFPLHVLRWLIRGRKGLIAMTAVVCLCCLLVMVYGCFLTCSLAAGGNPDFWFLALTAGLVAATLSAIFAAIKCALVRKVPLVMVFSGLASLGYFLSWTGGRTYYGLWLSAFASLLIAIGSFLEAIQTRRRPVRPANAARLE